MHIVKQLHILLPNQHMRRQPGAFRTFLAWRRHLAVSGKPVAFSNERFVATTLKNSTLGELTIGSIYLHQGDNLKQGSPADQLLENILVPLRDEGQLCILGGDFNQSPHKIAQWLFNRALPFRVVAQEDYTYTARAGASNIDFSWYPKP